MCKFFITINKFELFSELIKISNEEILLRHKYPIPGVSFSWLAKAAQFKDHSFNDR